MLWVLCKMNSVLFANKPYKCHRHKWEGGDKGRMDIDFIIMEVYMEGHKGRL